MNNWRILTIKNAKFSGYYFYMNLNIWGDSQICISVPLIYLKFTENVALHDQELISKIFTHKNVSTASNFTDLGR